MDPGASEPAGMRSAERARRVSAIVHTALLSSVGVYAVLLVFLRPEIAPSPAARPAGRAGLFPILAAVGAAQFAGASLVGRALLSSRRSGAQERVRLYFLLRAAAAEAIALYGLVLGLTGAPPAQIGALFALGVAALLVCAPGRAAWAEALKRAQSPSP